MNLFNHNNMELYLFIVRMISVLVEFKIIAVWSPAHSKVALFIKNKLSYIIG